MLLMAEDKVEAPMSPANLKKTRYSFIERHLNGVWWRPLHC